MQCIENDFDLDFTKTRERKREREGERGRTQHTILNWSVTLSQQDSSSCIAAILLVCIAADRLLLHTAEK